MFLPLLLCLLPHAGTTTERDYTGKGVGGLIGKVKQANAGTGEVGELFLIQLSSVNAPEVSDWEFGLVSFF